MKILSDIIIKPVISEKSYAAGKSNKYTFVVARNATKTNVKNAVEKVFGVKVIAVFTANIKGSKNKRTRFGMKKIDASYKKAMVEVAKGQKIDIYEEPEDEKKKKKER